MVTDCADTPMPLASDTQSRAGLSMFSMSSALRPGIGGAYKANCGDILINGGTINVRGGMTAAGIGGGRYAACGSITITDGVTRVKVTKGNPANYSIGAGNGNGASVGTVTIGGTVGAIGNSPYTYAPQH